jgi:hypothetical protein
MMTGDGKLMATGDGESMITGDSESMATGEGAGEPIDLDPVIPTVGAN